MTTQAHDLEQAILARAERLAAEFRERGQRARDAILREAAEKLRLREQREEAIAKSLGERTYRQRVQAEELRMQSELDLARWQLVCAIESQLKTQMQAYLADESAYLATLRHFIQQAAAQIEHPHLIVRVNHNDHPRLAAEWDAIESIAPADKTLTLDEQPLAIVAGVVVLSADARIRIDHSFEGRLARLQARIQQTILERLLPGGFETSTIFGG